jgi:hypothetical protein
VIITKNILSVKKGIICHQVNCLGIMGGGLALQIRNTYPEVYNAYRDMCNVCDDKRSLLGHTQFIKINDELVVANMFGQYNIGGNPATSYPALTRALQFVNQYSTFSKLPIYLPFKLGCGLANGNWETVKHIIEQTVPTATICKLGSEK